MLSKKFSISLMLVFVLLVANVSSVLAHPSSFWGVLEMNEILGVDPAPDANSAPVITEGTSVNVLMSEDGTPTAFSLTLNATDADGDTLTWSISTPAAHGTASASGTGPSKVIGYTPNTNYNGSDSFVVQVSDGNGGTDTIIVNVNIQAVNDAPVFTKGADQTVNEDAGSQTVAGWATGIDDGDPELTQTLTFNVTGNTNPSLFTVTPSINTTTGNLTYTLAANANGSATITLTLKDNGSGVTPNVNTSPPQTFTITVNAVNDAPVFNKGENQTVNEDAGAQTVTGWATGISDGDPELSQVLTFNIINNTNPALFSVSPSVSPTNGNLTYTPAANANGSATITITLSDDGSGTPPDVNTSASQIFTIVVTPINDVPVFTKGADQTVNEDPGSQTVSGWATGIDDGDPETSQLLTFNVTGNTNPTLFSTQPAVNPYSGNLTYTPAANANGSATITLTLSDNGPTTPPNINTSPPQTFTITVNALNDAPVFTKGADQTVNEDAGAQTVVGWATGIGDGDPELTQTLTFNVTGNTNPALFSVAPLVSETTGNLTYTPAPNANGSATITLTLSDNGSGTAPDVNTSAPQTFIITVNAVNDVPSFTKGANQTVNEDAGAQTVAGWATGIQDGDPELTQVLTFNVTDNTNPALFSAGPAVDGTTGDLTYTPAANANGSATITLTLSDDGSGTAPDINTSPPQTFTITVNAINDAPVANDQSVMVEENVAQAITLTSSDVEASPLTYSIVSNPSHGTLTGTPPNLTYTPDTDYNGPDSFTFKVNDGSLDSNTATVSISVGAVNDPPVITEGASTGVTMSEDGSPTPFSLTLNATDDDGDTLTWSISSQAANGTASASGTGPSQVIDYAPNANYNGSDSFVVQVSDGNGGTDTITVNVTIQAVNDVPSFTKGADQTVNEDAGAQTVAGWATGIEDGDPELSQTLTFNVTDNTNPTLFSAGPAVDATTGDLTYTSAANANGSATITLTLSDNGSGTAPDVNTSPPQTLTVTVNAVNDAPVANDQSVMVDEGVAKTITLTGSDVEGSPLTYSVLSNPSHGTLTGTPPNLTYTPDTNYNGPDSFTFKVNDGSLDSNTATVSITVGAVNDPPVITEGASTGVTMSEDGSPNPFSLTLNATDDDGDTLTWSISSQATNGTASASGTGTSKVIGYAPNANYNGSDSFVVQVSDGNGGTDTITVNVTIQAVNDAPVLNPIGNKSVDESVLLSFSATATDLDANTLTYSLVGAPSGAQIDPTTGAFTWTPAEAQGPGSYPFDICVSDDSLSDCETITVTVNEVNVAPVLAPVGNKSVAKNVLLSFTVTATDSDLPANPLTYSLVGAPSGAEINPTTGAFTWTPTDAQANNDYTFDVCVSDGVLSDCETITVTVTELVETYNIFMPMVTKSP